MEIHWSFNNTGILSKRPIYFCFFLMKAPRITSCLLMSDFTDKMKYTKDKSSSVPWTQAMILLILLTFHLALTITAFPPDTCLVEGQACEAGQDNLLNVHPSPPLPQWKCQKVFFWNVEFGQNVNLMTHLLNQKFWDSCTSLALAKTETKSYVTDI